MATAFEPQRVALLARRRALLETASRAQDELRGLQGATPDAELVEEAQRAWDQRLLEHLGHVERDHLEAIDLALQRIAEGRYGSCADCGGRIDDARLTALPTAARCTPCAEVRERAPMAARRARRRSGPPM